MARDLLGRYVDGPEADLIISSYQTTQDDQSRGSTQETSDDHTMGEDDFDGGAVDFMDVDH